MRLSDGFSEPVPLIPPGCTVGRGPVNDIVIASAEVSLFHADILVTDRSVTIRDTGTPGGTFVNGRRVITPATLKSGDTVTVGGVDLLVESRFKTVKTVDLSAFEHTGDGLLELGTGGWAILAESGPHAGDRTPVTGRITVGRSSSCDICLFDSGLSRQHAAFELNKNQLHIQDLISANGTWVNDTRVEKATLQDGDIVCIDKLRFRVIAPQ